MIKINLGGEKFCDWCGAFHRLSRDHWYFPKSWGGRPKCKKKNLAQSREWREKNPERARQKQYEWRARNPDRWAELQRAAYERARSDPAAVEKKRAYMRGWWERNGAEQNEKQRADRLLNPEKYRERDRLRANSPGRRAQRLASSRRRVKKTVEYNRRWRDENRERWRVYQREYVAARAATDDGFRTVKLLRSRLQHAFRKQSTAGKLRRSDEYGIDYCAIVDFLGPRPSGDHQIDHIVPISAFDFDDPVQVLAAFAPHNHQWLTAYENDSKNDRYDPADKAPLVEWAKEQLTRRHPAAER